MRKGKTKKLIALMLSVLMLVGAAVPALTVSASAETETGTKSSGDSSTLSGVSLQELSEDYTLISYEKYKEKYGYSTDMRTGWSTTFDASEYMDSETDAVVQKTEWEDKDCIRVADEGSVSWSVNVEETGFYCIGFTYSGVSSKTTDIERVLKINGKSPFSEARYLDFTKTWTFDYLSDDRDDAFDLDATGNELRPDYSVKYTWEEYSVHDNDGYYNTPFEFYLEKGENVITLEGVREEIALYDVSVYTYEELPSYADVLKEYEDKGYKPAEGDGVYLEAEMPKQVSNYTLYPVYDRASAITSPQDSAIIMRNTIGADKWTKSGQWIQYEFTCPASGLYNIDVRFNQDQIKGMYTSRSLKINGEYPFEEAKYCQFDYDNNWQSTALTDGNEFFQFYFEEGESYTIQFEVVLGRLADVIRQVNDVIESLNKDYMDIMELTGVDPDTNRDYGFSRIMPDMIRSLGTQSARLYNLVDYITEMNGIKSDNTSTLEQAAVLIERMASDEKEIAANLSTLKSWISSLGTWMSEASTQYLEMDFVSIQPAGSELPKGDAGGWSGFVFELKKFAASFYTDYNSLGKSDDSAEKTLSVWTSSGRDQAQIIKNLVDNNYTPNSHVEVSLKLVAAGTLLPSILAGVGPDVSIDATNPIDYAIRGAIIPLNDFDGFDEVMTRFADSATIPLSLYGTTYAIPVAQAIPVMFCRDDILSELGLGVPETWDDLMSMVPVLQFNNMDIGITNDFTIFLFQNGGKYWKDEGMSINFDAHDSLDSFENMCNMFTQYSLPVTYNAENRFKTGEMPLVMSAYSFYNNLVVFAPEIAGLWHFYEIPGTKNEETGEVDHTTVSGISGVIIPRGCQDEETSWNFIDWYSDKDFQVDYSNELTALLGPSAKQQVANLEALEELPWSEAEYKLLQKALQHTVALEQYPGSYYIARYSGFAFNAAYNKGSDPSDTLLGYVASINKELTRKRTEFKLMVDDEWQTIKDYMGFESFDEWREYWADLRDTTTDDIDCIQDGEDAEYTYADWMKENGLSADDHNKWEKEVRTDSTDLSFKDWLEK